MVGEGVEGVGLGIELGGASVARHVGGDDAVVGEVGEGPGGLC